MKFKSFPKFRKQKPEEELQKAVINYLRLRYPNAIVISTAYNGLKQKPGAARKAKDLGVIAGIPDLNIFYKGKFLGLELKAPGVKVFRKDGEIRKNEYLETQNLILQKIRDNGGYGEFAAGFDEVKSVLDKIFGI